jgi:hypothetical protein
VADETRWVAERELEFRENDAAQSQKVVVRIGIPEPEEDFWRCATLIDGAPTEGEVFHAYGEDSLQALLLGIQALAIRVKALGQTGKLTWFDGTDLGLPEPDTATD